MTTRTIFDGSTPDRPTFALSASPRTTFAPAPLPSLSQDRSYRQRTKNAFARFSARARDVFSKNTGMLLIASSQGFFSLMNVAVKKLNSLDPPVPAFELIFVRMFITWICCVTYMYFAKVPDPFLGPRGVRLLLAFRGFVGFFGLFGVYYSLQYLSLSDATVLTFLAPMFTIVTAAIFLGEHINWKQVAAGFCSLVGVVLIARPAFIFGRISQEISIAADGTGHLAEEFDLIPDATPAQRLGAVGVALLGVLGATGAYTTIRAIGKRAHPLHNLVSFSSLCVVVSVIAMISLRVRVVFPMRWDWLAMLLMIGIFGFMAQVLLTMGLQRETAGRGTMAVYVQIVFATAFEKIFFHSTPSPLSIVGTLIIMTAALYVAVTKEGSKSTHKRTASLAIPSDDISLEEGLLAHHDDDIEGDDKDLPVVIVSVPTPKLRENEADPILDVGKAS